MTQLFFTVHGRWVVRRLALMSFLALLATPAVSAQAPASVAGETFQITADDEPDNALTRMALSYTNVC